MKTPKTNSGYDIDFYESKIKPEEAHGISVEIGIVCETEEELLTHLSVIRAEVKRVLKYENEVKRTIEFSDNNCYGHHTVEIGLFKE